MNEKSFYKWIPGIGLVVLTIGLMFFFKNERDSLDQIVNTAETTLADFYTQNLKPIFYTTDLSNEDIFNFAMNENIPINKKDYLQLGTQDEDNVFFEVKKKDEAKVQSQKENYNKFISKLELSELEKERFDSLLHSYKDQIYSGILSDSGSNTVAVNPKLVITHSALVADILNFAESAKPPLPAEPPKPQLKKTVVSNLKKAAKEEYNEDYILINPDTAFQAMVAFNKAEFKKEIEEARTNQKAAFQKIKDLRIQIDIDENDFKESIDVDPVNVVAGDSGSYKVVLPKFSKYLKEIPELKSVEKELDSVAVFLEALNVAMDLSAEGIKINVNNSGVNTNVNVDFEGIDSIVSNSFKFIFENSEEDWEEFGRKMDSMAQQYEYRTADTTFVEVKKQD